MEHLFPSRKRENYRPVITPAGTNGSRTINALSGSVNFAASGGSAITVTNSLVTTSSLVFCQVASADATLKSVQTVKSNGSFTITPNAAATAATIVDWLVINGQQA